MTDRSGTRATGAALRRCVALAFVLVARLAPGDRSAQAQWGDAAAEGDARAARPADASDEPTFVGLYLAARTLGFAVPYGNASGALGDTLPARHAVLFLPIGIDAGIRLGDRMRIGANFTYNMGNEGSTEHSTNRCDNDYLTCSSSMLRVGLGAEAHFVPEGVPDPWLGLGFGMTRDSQRYHDSALPRDESNWSIGYEMIVSTGMQFRTSRRFAVGPFVSASIGRYVYASTEIDSETTAAGPFPHEANHGWLSAGLRMVLSP